MKLTKRQISLIVENFINEQDWLSDEEDDFYASSKMLSLEDKLNKAFKIAKNEVIEELKNADTKSQNIDGATVNEVIKIINQTYLHITDKVDIEFKGIKALAFHAGYGDEEGEDRKVLHFDKVPKDIGLPPHVISKINNDRLNNPLIVVFKLYAQNSSEKELLALLLHEVGHIKNGAIKALSDSSGKGPKSNFNVSQLKGALRKDLVKGNKRQITEYIVFYDKPKRIGSSNAEQDLVLRLAMYYQGLYETPPDNLGVEELSVRLSALKRNSKALEDFKSGKREYKYFAEEYNTDVADIMLFIDEETTIEDVNKIVKYNKKDNKSVTV